MAGVLLCTFALLPDGEMGGDLLRPLAERGIDARWVCWDDPDVDWGAADLVAVRATWDYHRRCPEFLAWAARVEEQTVLLNGADAFAWNSDKAYLTELADRVPVVPTELLDDRTLVPGLTAAVARWGVSVIKPRVGASGLGVVVAESVRDLRLEGLAAAPWVVQPLVESVRTEGEISVYVFNGRAQSQVHKHPAGDEIRIHELYGGRAEATAIIPETTDPAEAAVVAVGEVLGTPPAYARVDLMRYDGRLVVGEVELIEPGLYLEVDPGNAERFADLVAARL